MKNIAALVLCLMITVTAVSPATSPAIEGSVTPERKLSFAEKLTASPEDMLAHKRALATAAEKKASDAEKLVPTGDIKSKAAKNAQGLRKKATKARAEATKAETEGVSAGKLAKLFGNDKPQSSLSPSRGRSVSMPTSPSPEKLAGDATVPTSKPAPKEELVSDVGVASDEDSAHDSGEEGDDDSSLSDMVDDTAKSSAMKPLPMDDFMSEKLDGHPAFTPSPSVTKTDGEVGSDELVEDGNDKTIPEPVKTGIPVVVVTDTVDDSVVVDKEAPAAVTDSVVVDAPKAEVKPLPITASVPAPVVVVSPTPTQPAPLLATVTVVPLPQPPVSVLTNGGAVEEVVKQLPDLTEDEAAALNAVLLRAAGIVLMTPAIVYALYRLVHGLHKTNGLVDGAGRSPSLTEERPLSKRRIKDIVAALSLMTGAALVVAAS